MARLGFVGGAFRPCGLQVARAAAMCPVRVSLRPRSFIVTTRRTSTIRMQRDISGTKTVEIEKPLNITLEELESGNVFVAEASSSSNGGKAGLKRGDVILEVDGKKLGGVGLDKVMSSIKDSKNEKVKVLFERIATVKDEKPLDADVKQKLKSEISAPYRQNWLGIIIVGVLVLIAIGYAGGIRP